MRGGTWKPEAGPRTAEVTAPGVIHPLTVVRLTAVTARCHHHEALRHLQALSTKLTERALRRRSARNSIAKEGLRSFGEIHPSTVLRFLAYDNTNVAKRQGVQATQQTQQTKKSRGMCFKYNAHIGCDGVGCPFRHACVFCYETSHGSTNCRKGKGGQGRSSSKN